VITNAKRETDDLCPNNRRLLVEDSPRDDPYASRSPKSSLLRFEATHVEWLTMPCAISTRRSPDVVLPDLLLPDQGAGLYSKIRTWSSTSLSVSSVLSEEDTALPSLAKAEPKIIWTASGDGPQWPARSGYAIERRRMERNA